MNVSVVIPAKNEEGSIQTCLESLTSQTSVGDEIIVLDNGSTDSTAEIAESFGVTVIDAPDSRFEGSHYRGLAQLRQFGAEQASNAIVATTDADTCPPDDWVEGIKTHFEEDDDLSVLWGVVTDTNGVPVRNLTGKYLTFIGGVSGANTAFRRRDFQELKMGYTGWPMFEDVALITRLARNGKAVHDTEMVMRTDLDKSRYQTIPIVAAGVAAAAGGAFVGGSTGAAIGGAGVGFAGSELFGEKLDDLRSQFRERAGIPMELTPLHHDQIGLTMIVAGAIAGGTAGLGLVGGGAGVVAHHVLTEGVSALPSPLMKNTKSVCNIQEGGVVCETADDTGATVSRVLAGVTGGALIGAGAVVARERFG